MFKNTASQKLTVFAYDSTTNAPKTGDAAQITAYRDLDDGGVTVLGDTSATEKDSTNAKGYYIFDLTQGETNGDKILFSAKSSTANIVVLAVPPVVYTVPPNFSALLIASGIVSADVVKLNAVATSAALLERLAAGMLTGSVTGAATANSLIDSTLVQATADWFVNRVLIFLTGGIPKQAAVITAFDPALDKLFFTTVTAAPGAGDTYIII